MKRPWRTTAVAGGLLGLVVVIDRMWRTGPGGGWAVVAWTWLALVSLVAVPTALLWPTDDRMVRIRRVTVAWAALTILWSPVAYGMPLLVTVPGMAALVARLYVGSSRVRGRNVTCLFLGPAIAIGVLVIALRGDESLLEAIIASGFVIVGGIGLGQLRRQSRITELAA